MSETLLQVENLRTYFHTFRGVVKAVDGISFSLDEGQVLGIVGESGCGKSTLGRGVCKLENLTSGHVYLDGEDITEYNDRRMRSIRKKVQMAFDTYETAKSIMDKDLGVRKTVMLNKVYEELLSVTKGVSSYNIDEVKDDISEESMNGVIMCGYPVFKEIYHLEVRKSARSTIPESLVLVTVVPMYSSQPDKNHSQMKDSMHTLERALRKCLRVGDVAAKYSDSQYIVLLSKCSCDTASDVMKRIIDRFNHTCDTHSNMTIKFDIEPVSCYSSFVSDK